MSATYFYDTEVEWSERRRGKVRSPVCRTFRSRPRLSFKEMRERGRPSIFSSARSMSAS
jgi:hypothetical protein